MREVKAPEAISRFSELLQMVEHGETIAITRHGKTIAHVVPSDAPDRVSRQAAVERFRQRRAEWRRVNVSIEEILAWRHEGHRPCPSERGGAQGGI
ncbi:MAG: type II toxin-antitoxin system prevent-host-death family antitoxin [Chloroflexi bacterium]|nr:type II toxin-antitoxin system prevent-host-death family antitoxin [Chloroflexota bacterium]